MQRSAESIRGLCVRALVCERGGKTLFGPLDLAVERGEALFVLGPNGSGKSTLLRALAGLCEPLAAEVYWEGERLELAAPEWRARIAYVGHKLGHKEELTAAENLHLASTLEGMRVGADAHVEALTRVGLERRRALAVKRLSQGQKQRLALARLCLSERPIWLLDEPAAALDTNAVEALEAMLKAHLAGGGVAIVATHERIDVPGVRSASLRLA